MPELKPLIEIEEFILGSMLQQEKAFKFGCENLDSEHFFLDINKKIFKKLKDFYCNKKVVSLDLFIEEMKSPNYDVGRLAALITNLAMRGYSSYIEDHCYKLKDHANRHFLMQINKKSSEKIYSCNEPINSIIDNQINILKSLSHTSVPDDEHNAYDLINGKDGEISAFEEFKKQKDYFDKNQKPYNTGLPTGFFEIDNKTSILSPSNLIIIAARPAMGKTAFALNILSEIAFYQNKSVGIFSLEMSAKQLRNRLISMKSLVSGSKIDQGKIDLRELNAIQLATKEIENKKFYIYDSNINFVSDLVSKARRLKDKRNIDLLIIDYIGLIGSKSRAENRQNEVAEVSRSLKRLAIELDIPIVVVSQLSRKVENRVGCRPLMSDLRDSGQIEQDADSILFLHRRDYYDPLDKPGLCELILSKNRHGPTFSCDLKFSCTTGKFENLINIP